MKKSYVLRCKWNKNGSIVIRCKGKIVMRYEGVNAYDSAQSFILGWYGKGVRKDVWTIA